MLCHTCFAHQNKNSMKASIWISYFLLLIVTADGSHSGWSICKKFKLASCEDYSDTIMIRISPILSNNNLIHDVAAHTVLIQAGCDMVWRYKSHPPGQKRVVLPITIYHFHCNTPRYLTLCEQRRPESVYKLFTQRPLRWLYQELQYIYLFFFSKVALSPMIPK